ncbi:hypothetical protein GCM10010384_19100 [Streptomyces djakartensis]|uniref:Condensation protein n=1 Tax=Streptomyces djakartensis TaxID=68193 RepID=A0ABQ2ZF34_9ACTN|nr:hypothetical protein GCM10010384_19100 [Streptomyces djakartensis]
MVDEVSRHCLQEEEPETVHIEVHLPGPLDERRLRKAFTEALHRHPRILMREAPGSWFRRRYEWELTADPDTEVVTFTPAGPRALQNARTRALAEAPPLSLSPPIRLEVVELARAAGGRAAGAVPPAHGGPPCSSEAENLGEKPGAWGRVGDGGPPCSSEAESLGEAPRNAGLRNPPPPAPTPSTPEGTVLLLTINHTALDGPACLRVLATAAELYGGRDNAPAAPPTRAARTPHEIPDLPANWSPPARVAPGTPDPSPGNGMLVAELPLPHRPKGSPYTVNDQLMVTTALTIAHWNREHGTRPRPLRITMPVDDRPRDTTMPIGNGTRLVEVPFLPAELDVSDMSALLRRTAERTRALKSLPRPQLGHGATLLTTPWAPVGVRAALTRGLRRAAAPWTSTTLLSNIGRIPYPLDFGEEAGRAHAVWFSAPARMPRGLTVTTASTAGRLHLALRWSRSLLSHGDGARLRDLFEHHLHTTEVTP